MEETREETRETLLCQQRLSARLPLYRVSSFSACMGNEQKRTKRGASGKRDLVLERNGKHVKTPVIV